MSVADELKKLDELRQSGALTDDEFAKAKEALLSGPASVGAGKPDEHLDEIRYQNELAQIDREWQLEREQYLITDRYGRSHVPRVGGGQQIDMIRKMSRGAGMVVAVVGVVWTIGTIFLLQDGPQFLRVLFPLFGVLFVIFGLSSSFGMNKFMEGAARNYAENAAKYQESYERYQQRRKEVVRSRQQI